MKFPHTIPMEKWLQESKKIENELIAHRRYLHENAEVGFALPKTTSYIVERLQEYGYAPTFCGKSVVATVGKATGNAVLLRADTDALPIEENSGEQFAAKNGNMHACGHDMHAAMLLGAAKLLKRRENELSGCVKLLFQPAEERLEGAKDALKNGLLDSPKPQAAFMLHVMTATELPTGKTVVASGGVSAPAADFFTLTVKGKGCHGSTPWEGVDALTVAARIVLAFEELSAREIPVATPIVLTVGSMRAGEASNAVSDAVSCSGTLRAFDEGARAYVKTRMEGIAKGIASAFRATAKLVYTSGCPALVNDETLSNFALKTAKNLLGEGEVYASDALSGGVKNRSGGSEDFAYIAREIPSVMLALSAGERGKGYTYPLHHPKVQFDESALSIGCALYARLAAERLKRS